VNKVVPVRKTHRVVGPISDERMAVMSQDDLVRLVRRLHRQGLNAEQIKEWFVENIPMALRSATLHRG